jgi:hypothetical protein
VFGHHEAVGVDRRHSGALRGVLHAHRRELHFRGRIVFCRRQPAAVRRTAGPASF